MGGKWVIDKLHLFRLVRYFSYVIEKKVHLHYEIMEIKILWFTLQSYQSCEIAKIIDNIAKELIEVIYEEVILSYDAEYIPIEWN